MADYIATIKVNIEAATGEGGGGATGGVADITGAVVRSIKQLQDEFRNLSASVRSVVTSLDQIKNVKEGASGSTGAPSVVSAPEGGPKFSDTVKALSDVEEAASGAAAAAKEQVSAQDEATASSRRAAEAASTEAEMLAKASKAKRDSAEATDAATAADLARVKAFKLAEGGAPRRNSKDRLNTTRVFSEIAQPAAASEGVRKAASKTIEDLAGLIKIPPSVTGDAKKSADQFKKNMVGIIRDLFTGIAEGGLTGTQINKRIGAIREQQSQAKETLGTSAPVADTESIKTSVAARALVQSTNDTSAALHVLTKAILEGASAEVISTATSGFQEKSSSTKTLLQGVARPVFSNSKRTGQPLTEGGAETFQRLRDEGLVSATSPKFTGQQNEAFKSFKAGISSLDKPMEVVQRIIKDLVNSGKGLDGLDATLRNFKDRLGGFAQEQANFVNSEGDPDRGQLLVAREVKGLLDKVKIGDQGQLNAPQGAVSRQDSILSAQAAIQQARVRAAAAGPDTGEQRIQVPVVDAQGNIKKLDVALKAFGKTVDSVRVKTSDLSKNTFDRTSVKAALQRVAVWGAAAGIVFGAFNALRQGISVMIDTESALVSLAKVMNESAVNLDVFKSKAKDAATTISQEFGQPLEEVLETMILFGQQGKTLSETIDLSRASALASSVTTLNQPEAASALTAATQQFGLAFSDAESIVDKFNEVANNAAVTETDLAQALKKSGQAAKNAGVDLDQFNGIVASIAEQTRQSGNEIGTALRFIFSRLQRPEAEKGLRAVGVNARDAAGNIRGFVPIVSELAAKFDTLTDSQKTQVAISVAGTRRFNTLLALLDNFGSFQDSAADSANSAGSAMREQSQVVDTAAFKIQQLSNSLKDLALSFSSTLLGPLKLAVDGLSGLSNAVSFIPGFMKTAAAATAIGSIAFIKFSDHITDFLGLAGSIKGAGGVFGGALTRGLSQGLSVSDQIERADAVGGGFEKITPGVVAARTAADLSPLFGKGATAAASFSGVLAKSNRQLLDMRGNTIKTASVFGKLGATIRGFKTVAGLGDVADGAVVSTLAIGGLNSGLTRFIGFLGVMSRKLVALTLVGPLAFKAIDAAAVKAGASSLAAGKSIAAVGTALQFAGALGVIYGVVWGIGQITDAAHESGQEVQKSLEPEIEKRKQIIAELGKTEAAVNSLTEARRKAASVSISSPNSSQRLDPTQSQDVLAGRFRSPEVALNKLQKQEQEVANNIGLANPALIDSIDKFGNVVLSSATAFDVLAQSASTAQKTLLGLAQTKVIGGFSDELKPEEGILKGSFDFLNDNFLQKTLLTFVIPDDLFQSASEDFDRQLKEFNKQLSEPVALNAQALGVSVQTLSETAGEELKKAGQEFNEASLVIREIVQTINNQIDSLPEDSGQLVFESLAKRAAPAFNRQSQLLATQGIEAGTPSLLNDAFLKNRSSLKNVKGSIAETNALTVGNLREAGQSPEFLDISADRSDSEEKIKKIVQSFQGGELVLFKDVKGLDQKAVVTVTDSGKRIVTAVADDVGRFASQELGDVLSNSLGDFLKLDTTTIAAQFTVALKEVGRTLSGAGRGSLLTQDIDLGANFRSDISAQQRASQGDELLFSDLGDKKKEVEDFIKSITADGKLEDSGKQLSDPGILSTVRKLGNEFANLATSARFATEIENVGIAFEKATLKIRDSRIDEALEAQFSGSSSPAAIKSTLSVSSLKDFNNSAAPNTSRDAFTQLGNQLSDSQKAIGKSIATGEKSAANIKTFADTFRVSNLGGASGDPERLTDLARRAAGLSKTGLNDANSILATLSGKQLQTQESIRDEIKLLNANITDNPKAIGAALAQSAIRNKGDDNALSVLAAQVESRDDVSSFSSQDQQTLVSILGRSAVPSLEKETKLSASNILSGELVTALALAAKQESGKSKGDKKSESDDAKTNEKLAQDAKKTQTLLQSVFSDFTATPQFDKIAEARDSGGSLELDDSVLDEFTATFLATIKKEGGSDGKRIAKAIQKLIDAGGESESSIRETIEKFVLAATNFKAPEATNTVPTTVRDFEKDAAAGKAQLDALKATNIANDKQQRALLAAVEAVERFDSALKAVTGSLQTSVQKTIDEISVGRSLTGLTGPQIGPLAGIDVPSLQVDPRGDNIAQLSGKELTAIENKSLARGVTETDLAFKSLVTELGNIKRVELEAERALKKSASQGDTAGVDVAREALQQLGNVSTLVEGQVNNAKGTLKTFGEAFKGLEAVNQLRVDVEKLIQSFDKEIELKFDTTSIDTAFGKTPFSATRPTFEQAGQGQAGNLTKFERIIAGINFQESAGTLSSDEASFKREEATFNKDEDVIALAQSTETGKLQAAVKTAEQVRSRLFDFVQSGGAGSDVAQTLLSQITSELEQAGDIVPGGTARSIRDPRTGQQIDVPASQVNTFKGLPGLTNITQQLAGLSKQAEQDTAQRDADLITKPLTSLLEQSVAVQEAQLVALKEASGVDDPKGLTDVSAGLLEFAKLAPTLIKALQEGTLGDQAELTRAIGELSAALSPDVLKTVLQKARVTTTEGEELSGSAVLQRARDLPDQTSDDKKNINALIDSVFDKANEGLGKVIEDAGRSVRGFQEVLKLDGDGLKTLSGGASEATTALLDFAKQLPLIGDLLKALVSNKGGSTSNASAPNNFVEKFAQGGLITGPGGPREDRVPILASPGEFIVNAKAASSIGVGALNQLNSSSGTIGPNPAASGASRGFALGGLVADKRPEPYGWPSLKLFLDGEYEAAQEAEFRNRRHVGDSVPQAFKTAEAWLKGNLENKNERDFKASPRGRRAEIDRLQNEKDIVSESGDSLGRSNVGYVGETGAESVARQEAEFKAHKEKRAKKRADLDKKIAVAKEELSASSASEAAIDTDIEGVPAALASPATEGRRAKQEAERDAFSVARGALDGLLRKNTGAAMKEIIDNFGSSQSQLATAREVSNDQIGYAVGDVDTFADSMDRQIIDSRHIEEKLRGAEKVPLRLAAPNAYDLASVPNRELRAERGASAAGITVNSEGGFDPFAGGYLFNVNPESKNVLAQYARNNTHGSLLADLEVAQRDVRAGNSVAGAAKQGIAAAQGATHTAIIDAGEYWQDQTDSETLKDIIGGTTGQVAGVTDFVGGIGGFGANVLGSAVSGEFDARKLANVTDLDLGDIRGGFEAVGQFTVDTGSHLYHNSVDTVKENARLYEELNNTQDPVERRRIRRELMEAQSKAFGAAVEVGLAIQPLSLLKGKVPPLSANARAAKKISSVRALDDLAENARRSSQALRHTDPPGAKAAHKQYKAFQKEAAERTVAELKNKNAVLGRRQTINENHAKRMANRAAQEEAQVYARSRGAAIQAARKAPVASQVAEGGTYLERLGIVDRVKGRLNTAADTLELRSLAKAGATGEPGAIGLFGRIKEGARTRSKAAADDLQARAEGNVLGTEASASSSAKAPKQKLSRAEKKAAKKARDENSVVEKEALEEIAADDAARANGFTDAADEARNALNNKRGNFDLDTRPIDQLPGSKAPTDFGPDVFDTRAAADAVKVSDAAKLDTPINAVRPTTAPTRAGRARDFIKGLQDNTRGPLAGRSRKARIAGNIGKGVLAGGAAGLLTSGLIIPAAISTFVASGGIGSFLLRQGLRGAKAAPGLIGDLFGGGKTLLDKGVKKVKGRKDAKFGEGQTTAADLVESRTPKEIVAQRNAIKDKAALDTAKESANARAVQENLDVRAGLTSRVDDVLAGQREIDIAKRVKTKERLERINDLDQGGKAKDSALAARAQDAKKLKAGNDKILEKANNPELLAEARGLQATEREAALATAKEQARISAGNKAKESSRRKATNRQSEIEQAKGQIDAEDLAEANTAVDRTLARRKLDRSNKDSAGAEASLDLAASEAKAFRAIDSIDAENSAAQLLRARAALAEASDAVKLAKLKEPLSHKRANVPEPIVDAPALPGVFGEGVNVPRTIVDGPTFSDSLRPAQAEAREASRILTDRNAAEKTVNSPLDDQRANVRINPTLVDGDINKTLAGKVRPNTAKNAKGPVKGKGKINKGPSGKIDFAKFEAERAAILKEQRVRELVNPPTRSNLRPITLAERLKDPFSSESIKLKLDQGAARHPEARTIAQKQADNAGKIRDTAEIPKPVNSPGAEGRLLAEIQSSANPNRGAILNPPKRKVTGPERARQARRQSIDEADLAREARKVQNPGAQPAGNITAVLEREAIIENNVLQQKSRAEALAAVIGDNPFVPANKPPASSIVKTVVRASSSPPPKLTSPPRPPTKGVDGRLNRVNPVDPEFLGIARNKVSALQGKSFSEAQSAVRVGLDEGFTLDQITSRKLEPSVRGVKIGEAGDDVIVAQRLENILEAPQGTLSPERIGPKLQEKFLDVSAEDFLQAAIDGNNKSAVVASRLLRDKRGGSNIQQIIDEIKPIIDEFKAGKRKLPDILEVEDLLKGPNSKFAQGGKVTGPGGPTSDRIPILTSPGEFVLNANAVGQIGLPVIESMNRTGILPKFQDGGLVSGDTVTIGKDEFEKLKNEKGPAAGATFEDFFKGPPSYGPQFDKDGKQTNGINTVNIFPDSPDVGRSGRRPSAPGYSFAPNSFGGSGGFSAATFSADSGLIGEEKRRRSALGLLTLAADEGNRRIASANTVYRGRNERLQRGLDISSGGDVISDEQIIAGRQQPDFGIIGPPTSVRGGRRPNIGSPSSGAGSLSSVFPFVTDDGRVIDPNARFRGDALTSTPDTPGPGLSRAAQLAAFAEQDSGPTRVDFTDLSDQPRFVGKAALSDKASLIQGALDDDEDDLRDAVFANIGGKSTFANGGRISGPGGATSDGIPILVSNGEYVVNAAAASKVGLANLESLNRGVLPRFAEGGSVDGATSVGVDTEAIASAITSAISQALGDLTIAVDSTTASESISAAVTAALSNIEPLKVEKVELDAQEITVKLDTTTVKLDTAGAGLGDSVGAGIRDRMEKAESSIKIAGDAAFDVADALKDIDLDALKGLITKVTEVDKKAQRAAEVVDELKRKSEQEVPLDHKLDHRSNMENNKDTGVNDVNVRIDKEISNISTQMAKLERKVEAADRKAGDAFNKALAK